MKPRNREINIFNMSLLDILCGALGAFCFLMLALFPYYAKGSGAAGETDAKNARQELEQAKAQLQKALEQMSKMSQGQPADVSQLMQQIEAARAREQQALQHLQQMEQQLAQARNKAQDRDQLANEIFNLTDPTLVISASWEIEKADVDMWVKNPNKTWDGPKKQTPDGAKLLYQFNDATVGPATEHDYWGGAPYGRYEVYFRLASRGETPPQVPVIVHAVATKLYLFRKEDKRLNMGRLFNGYTVSLTQENKLVPAFVITLDDKGMKLEPLQERAS